MADPLDTPTISEIPTDRQDVAAFRVSGVVSADDFAAMGERMNAVFDAHDKVSMLLLMQDYRDSESGAGWDWETMKSQFRSVSKLDKYVVVGAPDEAEKMIRGFGKVLPLEAETFPADREAEAWATVGAHPAEGGTGPAVGGAAGPASGGTL